MVLERRPGWQVLLVGTLSLWAGDLGVIPDLGDMFYFSSILSYGAQSFPSHIARPLRARLGVVNVSFLFVVDIRYPNSLQLLLGSNATHP